MSVNSLQIEDVYQILNSIHSQATGQTALAPTNTYEFTSMATTTLAAGVDTVYNALMNTIGRTVFSVRPYERKFSGLVQDNVRWGAIMRKISYADKAIGAEEAFHPVDGTTVDPWKINKANVLEMRYYGSAVYQDTTTIFRDQLMQSFESPEQLGSFVSGQMTHMSNKWEQYLENLNRSTLANFIGAKIDASNGVIHLLTEYNTLINASPALTAADVWQPQNFNFWRWVRGRINTLGRRMAERSGEYQVQVTGKEIMRHTPYADQRIYLLSDAMDIIDTMVNTTTFHDEPLSYANVEGVSYWQDINTPASIDVTPAVINSSGVVSQGTAVQQGDIFGVMFDRDAIGTNVKLYDVANSPYNQVGRYYNTTLTANLQFTNDLTEKGIVLLLD